MLGGQQWSDEAGGAESAAQVGGPGPRPAENKGKPTKPMGVNEFLDKGLGGAQLPRKRCVPWTQSANAARCHGCNAPGRCNTCRQDRKDKEKDKRLRGQSTHAAWKSEAEMVLRQQYD